MLQINTVNYLQLKSFKMAIFNPFKPLKNSELENLPEDIRKKLFPGGIIPTDMEGNPSGQVFKAGKAACAIVPLVIICLIGALVGNFFYGDTLFPNSIRGHVVDLVYLPGEKDQNRIWLKTDDSFYYTQRMETGSSLSISTESLFNKTYDYIYDPVTKAIIYKNKNEFSKTPPKSRLYFYDGKVWEINPDDGNNSGSIYTYDPSTGKKSMTTEDFIAKWPQLKSGIAKISILDKPDRIDITANDGQTGLYYLAEDKMYKDAGEYNKARDSQTGEMNIYALAEDGKRMQLYKVTGPAAKIGNTDIMGSTLTNPDSMKFFYDATATALTPDKVYLEGIIVYSDTDYILIIHQSSAGKDATRLLTCVTSDGKTLWTINQDQLLPEMRYNPDDSFSQIFFVKDDFRGERGGELFLFKMREIGVMGIDLPTGTVKWTFRQ